MGFEFDVNERPESTVSGGRGYSAKELDQPAPANGASSGAGEPSQPTGPAEDGTGAGKNFLARAHETREKREKANQAAMGSLSGLKVLGNALSGVLHHSKGLSEEEVDQRTQQVLEHFAEQSVKLHEKLDLPDLRYVRESVTGSLAKIISQHYQVAGEKALEMDWSNSLSKLATMDGVWEPSRGDDDWTTLKSRRSMAMMQALSPVMTAYQSWNYHHAESEPVMQRLGDLMWRTTDDALSRHPVAEDMSEKEREILRYNLLYRAGEIMGNSWYANIRETLSELAAMPAEDRRYYQANGYPLDKIENSFRENAELLYSGLSVSLSVHADMPERQPDAELNDDTAPGPSPG